MPWSWINGGVACSLDELEGVKDVSGSHGDVGISGMGSFVRFKNDAEFVAVYLCTEILSVD